MEWAQTIDKKGFLKPINKNGVLKYDGQVEVVSSVHRDGKPVYRDLRWGVDAVLQAPNDYAASCFKQYGMNTDDTGEYSAMYKPFHLIGMELNTSIFSAALLKIPTGQTKSFLGDVVATSKKKLLNGSYLDGEGGSTVWGKLIPAEKSLKLNALPIGLANKLKLKNYECIAIEDTEISMKSANKAKIKCIAFPGNFHTDSKFKNSLVRVRKLNINLIKKLQRID